MRSLREVRAEHLVVGADLLGLSVADHLLRRGATGVVLLDGSTVAPPQREVANPGLLLRTGLPQYRAWEDRGFLLLEEWRTYLEADPGYRRSGSFLVSPPKSSRTDGELLDADDVTARSPGLMLPAGAEALFVEDDGKLDAVALSAALYRQVRRRGGTLFMGSEVRSLSRVTDGFRFAADGRGGVGERVYLAGGISALRHLSALGIPSTHRVSTWHRFHLEVDRGNLAIVRFTDGDDAVLHDTGDGELIYWRRDREVACRTDPAVGWVHLENLRATTGAIVPGLADARIRRGSAESRLDLDPEAPGIIHAAGGRLFAAGAFGVHDLLLALPLGERIAELGLGLDPGVPDRPPPSRPPERP